MSETTVDLILEDLENRLEDQVPSLLTDVRYAIRQLREHRCISRALDALERVELALAPEVES